MQGQTLFQFDPAHNLIEREQHFPIIIRRDRNALNCLPLCL